MLFELRVQFKASFGKLNEKLTIDFSVLHKSEIMNLFSAQGKHSTKWDLLGSTPVMGVTPVDVDRYIPFSMPGRCRITVLEDISSQLKSQQEGTLRDLVWEDVAWVESCGPDRGVWRLIFNPST